MQYGAPFDIPLTVDLHIEDFSGGVVTGLESGARNMMIDQYTDGRWYVTQRPGVNQFEDCSSTVSDARGRGCYYWDAVGDRYIVNNDTVYKTSYSGSTMSISAGTERVFIGEVGNYLVIIDQENNEGWYIAAGTPTVIAAITDSNFPPNQSPTALELARGGAVLNDKLYVPCKTGEIYECDPQDPTTWGALSFRSAEMEPDKNIAMSKHKEHVVVWGSRSLEFFQDTSNPTGSTLTPRLDVSYDIGAADTDGFWQAGDTLYFVGQTRSNSLGVYKLENFQLIPISKEDMGTFLTSAVNTDNIGITCCAASAGQREFLFLTLYNTPSDISPLTTLVYSAARNWWGFWDTQLTGVTKWPVIAWMPSDTTRTGEGILANGDLVTLADDFVPQDTKDAVDGVYESGVYEAGIYTAAQPGTGTEFDFEIVTGVIHLNSPRKKRMGDLWSIHTPTDTSENITISFADEQNTTFDAHDTIDVSDIDDRITRCGQFSRRNIKVTGTLSDQWQAEKLQATVRIG